MMADDKEVEQRPPKLEDVTMSPLTTNFIPRRRWYSNLFGCGKDKSLLALLQAQAMLFKNDNKKSQASDEKSQ